MEDEIRGACAAHVLTFVRILPTSGQASRYVAEVTTADGARAVLKQGVAGRAGEIVALKAWKGTGYCPELFDDYGQGLFLEEWVPGETLMSALADGSYKRPTLGAMLRALHGVPMPDGLQPADVPVGALATWANLSPGLIASGESATAVLRDLAGHQPTTLHGDLAVINVLVADGRPKVIDPAGLRGPAALDIGQLAVMTFGRTGERILDDLVEGYESEPPALPEAVLFFVLLNLAMAGPSSGQGKRMVLLLTQAGQDPLDAHQVLR